MKRYLPAWGILLIITMIGGCAPSTDTSTQATVIPGNPLRPLRVFWLNSFAKDDPWSAQVRTGLRETLARAGYDEQGDFLTWEELHMQTVLYAPEDLEEVAQSAILAIESFHPDIVVTSGNAAASLVIPNYPNSDVSFVYCGVSGELRDMGLRLPNVTGVLEEYHPVQTVEIASTFVGHAQRYLILSDTSSAGQIIARRSYRELITHTTDQQGRRAWTGGRRPPDMLLVDHWPVWQQVVSQSDESYDFILLGSYRAILRDNGLYVPPQTVVQWMFENSPVPIFALENQAVVNGAVGGLVTYGYEQGRMAAKLVIQIANGVPPSNISEHYPEKSLLAVNLAGVHHWNLRIPVTFPIAARVYRTMPYLPEGELFSSAWMQMLPSEGGR